MQDKSAGLPKPEPDGIQPLIDAKRSRIRNRQIRACLIFCSSAVDSGVPTTDSIERSLN